MIGRKAALSLSVIWPSSMSLYYLGQSLLGIILRSMGAAGFRFLISGKIVYIAIPLLVFIAAIGAMLPGIGKIKPYECCMERE